MFNLRREQLKAFEDVAAQGLEQRVLIQLGEAFPNECGRLDAALLAATARYGIERAKSYGISAEADLCKYVGVMLALGKDFDVDPQYPWASRTLRDESLGGPGARVNRLSAEAREIVRQRQSGAASR